MVKVIAVVQTGSESEGPYGYTVRDVRLRAQIDTGGSHEQVVSYIECSLEEAERVVLIYNETNDTGITITLAQALDIVREHY